MMTALALTATLSFETTPRPVLEEVEVVATGDRELFEGLVETPGGGFFVLHSKPGAGGWPTAWIDRHDAQGERLWSHHHEITRTPAGNGFTRFTAMATDHLGNLYFGYHTHLNGWGQFLVKLNPDHTVAWEHKVEKCSWMEEVLPMPGATDVMVVCALNGGGTMATRRAEDTGAEVWRTFSSESGVTERSRTAMLDNFQNVYVVADWNGSHTDDHRRGTVLHKFAPDGTRLWRRQYETPAQHLSDPGPLVADAFVAKDHGVLAVVKMRATDTIEVHKYDAKGKRQARHVLKTSKKIYRDAVVRAAHLPQNDHVYVAWDDQGHDDTPATEWGMAVVRFEKKHGRATTTAWRSRAAPATTTTSPKTTMRVRPHRWVGKTLRIHRIASDDHDYLVDMDVQPNGRVVLAGVDRTAGRDDLRVTLLPRVQGGDYETMRYGTRARQSRPKALFFGRSDRIHVLGSQDGNVGPYDGHDADVLRLEIRTEGSRALPKAAASKRPTIRPVARRRR